MNKLIPGFISSVFAFTAFTGTAIAAEINDSEIAAIAQATNTAEINAGRLAMEKAQNSEVKEFAQEMVESHTAMNEDLAELKMQITMDDKSQQIKQDAIKTLDKLKGMQGAEFDRAYIQDQVKMHQKVLKMLNDKLIPKARNENLKAALHKAGPEVSSHLERAREIQSSMR